MKRNLLAIINPISGTGKQKGIENKLANLLDKNKFHLFIKHTDYAGHASELAKQAIESDIDAVLAVGGDGTINEVARSLVGSNIIMGIIPCGSGNGLARHIGIPMNVDKAIKWLNTADITAMDTVRANGKLFTNVGGLGFDAHISHEFDKMNSRGFVSYFKAVVKSYISYKEKDFIIETEGRKIESKGFLLSFANSSQFGNNAYIAPNASIIDGEINLVLLRKPKLLQIPSLAIKMFTKKLEKSPLVTVIRGGKFNIKQNAEVGHVDGEPVVFGEEVSINIDSGSLNIYCSDIC